MKKSLLILVLCLCSIGILFAQTPQALNYQTVVRDAGGTPLLNQPVNFRIAILSGTPTGATVYQETHLDTTSSIGLSSFRIGEGAILLGAFSGIDWGADTYYLKVELDAAGGTSFTEMGTTQFVSVPYALYAASSGAASNVEVKKVFTVSVGQKIADFDWIQIYTNGTNGELTVEVPSGAANTVRLNFDVNNGTPVSTNVTVGSTYTITGLLSAKMDITVSEFSNLTPTNHLHFEGIHMSNGWINGIITWF